MNRYVHAYRQASRAIKAFILTVILLCALLLISTVWAYVRLYTARTNIPTIHAEVNMRNSLDK